MQFQDLTGRTLGQYELRQLLGVGGMGVVYRAYQISLGVERAVKVLPAEAMQQGDYKARFLQEVETAAALEHPHIVPIVDYGTEGDVSYVVMRLLTGGGLDERLRDHPGGMSAAEVSRLLRPVASALDYAHSKGVLHRDVKPSNIMFDEMDNAYLVDFGIARLLNATRGITKTGMVVGTPSYMAPEQWRNENLTAANDQYALAVVAYQMLSGKLPFTADTPYGLMNMHLTQDPAPVKDSRTDLPNSVDVVLNKALAKEPEARFSSVTAFIDALRDAASGRGGGTRMDMDAAAAQGRGAGRGRGWIPFVIVGVLLVGVALVALAVLGAGDDDRDVAVAPTSAPTLVPPTATSLPASPTPPPTAIAPTDIPPTVEVAAVVPTQEPSATETFTPLPTETPVPPTATSVPPSETSVPATVTPPPTATAIPPTVTPLPTATAVPPTITPPPTATAVPPTVTPLPTNTPVPPAASPTDAFSALSNAIGAWTPIPTEVAFAPDVIGGATGEVIRGSDGFGILLENLETGVSERVVTGYSESIAWSPDGATIAYESGANLALRNIVTGESTSFSADIIGGGIDFSPDGTRIVYASEEDGDDEIYVVDMATRDKVKLTDNSAVDFQPQFSPDGSQIAFVSNRAGGGAGVDSEHDLYIMNADGSNVERVTSGANISFIKQISWSPDGDFILFEGGRGLDAGIYRFNVLTRRWQFWLPGGGYADYSPDGNDILLMRQRGDTSWETCIYQANAALVNCQDGGEQGHIRWRPPVVGAQSTSETPAREPTEVALAAPLTFEQAYTFARPPVLANNAWSPYEAVFDDISMVLVPVGCFTMGSSVSGESPAHEVCFEEPFWIDRYEVSNMQTGVFVEAELPRNVSWDQARLGCELRGDRLATEAEWEYAARGPDGLQYPWGDTFDGTRLNYCDQSCPRSLGDTTFNDGFPEVGPVGQYPNGASWVGAEGFAGNVSEWTLTEYRGYPYDATDGRNETINRSVPRVIRGTSWIHVERAVRLTARTSAPVDGSTMTAGYRCVREIKTEANTSDSLDLSAFVGSNGCLIGLDLPGCDPATAFVSEILTQPTRRGGGMFYVKAEDKVYVLLDDNLGVDWRVYDNEYDPATDVVQIPSDIASYEFPLEAELGYVWSNQGILPSRLGFGSDVASTYTGVVQQVGDTRYLLSPTGSVVALESDETWSVVVPEGLEPTAIPTRHPSPTPEPEQPEVEITVPSANLRSGPGTEYSVLQTAFDGDIYTVTGQAARWYQIELDDGGEAWVSSEIVDANDAARLVERAVVPTLSLAESVSTPTPISSDDTDVTVSGDFVTGPVGLENCFGSTTSVGATVFPGNAPGNDYVIPLLRDQIDGNRLRIDGNRAFQVTSIQCVGYAESGAQRRCEAGPHQMYSLWVGITIGSTTYYVIEVDRSICLDGEVREFRNIWW